MGGENSGHGAALAGVGGCWYLVRRAAPRTAPARPPQPALRARSLHAPQCTRPHAIGRRRGSRQETDNAKSDNFLQGTCLGQLDTPEPQNTVQCDLVDAPRAPGRRQLPERSVFGDWLRARREDALVRRGARGRGGARTVRGGSKIRRLAPRRPARPCAPKFATSGARALRGPQQARARWKGPFAFARGTGSSGVRWAP